MHTTDPDMAIKPGGIMANVATFCLTITPPLNYGLDYGVAVIHV